MLLVIDVGNTHTVMGLYHDELLVHHWRVRTEKDVTEDELHVLLTNLFAAAKVEIRAVKAVIISCVVPPIITSLRNYCNVYLKKPVHWVDTSTCKAMPILYDDPKEVGADRIVNAVAAFHKYRKALVVVDFGTATTFDCISHDGAYLGGAISPGLLISAEALFQQASKLPRVEIFVQPKSVIAKNTVSSMNAGIIYGYAGLVDGIVKRIRTEMSHKPKVIATGGLAELIAGISDTIEAVEPHLTLEGLRILYQALKGS
ncbi:MAG: type III pantothenate kinase [Deltaproteobacteria bacterium]|nr:type III pantothenate kinase [Deltaproteobacteria bacterium]